MTIKKELTEQLKHLVKLQSIDSKRITLEREKNKFPQIIKEASTTFDRLKKQLDLIQKKIDKESGTKRELERELQVENDKIQKKKDRASELKTNKEYETHLHEIKLANEHVENVEEKILESFERIDTVEVELKKQKKLCSTSKKTLKVTESEITDRETEIDKKINNLADDYSKLEVNITPKLLTTYNKTKNGNGGLGLVEVKNGVCAGCHLSLMPQFAAEVKKQDKIYTCPHCFRMLYFQEPVKVEEEAAKSE